MLGVTRPGLLATGVAVEVDGCIIEEASRLREDDAAYINMAELVSVIAGLNIALAWMFKRVELCTDSSIVYIVGLLTR